MAKVKLKPGCSYQGFATVDGKKVRKTYNAGDVVEVSEATLKNCGDVFELVVKEEKPADKQNPPPPPGNNGKQNPPPGNNGGKQ